MSVSVSAFNNFQMVRPASFRAAIHAILIPVTHEVWVEITYLGRVTVLHYVSANPSIISDASINRLRRRLINQANKPFAFKVVGNLGTSASVTTYAMNNNGGMIHF